MKEKIGLGLSALFCLAAAAWYVDAVAGDVLSRSIRFTIQFTTVLLAIGLVIWLLAFAWIALERARAESERRLEARARRRLVERESDVFVVVARRDEQVHIRETSKEAVWRPAHLDQRLAINGRQRPPTGLEVMTWAAWQQSGRSAGPALPVNESSPALETPVELPTLVRWFDLVPHHRGDLQKLILGVRLDETGRLAPVTISLYDLFHTIVAASSGWGKSAFANAILTQLATCQAPVELVLIDQQEHGLAAFKQCARLRYPLLRQPNEILSALREVYEQATRQRSALFARYDADDLAEYNRLADDYLPPIVVAVDEASALLANKEIGAELKQQAWELRKFGVYQILILTSAKGTTIDTDHRQQFSSKVQLHANERTQARLLIDEALEATSFPPGRAVVELPGQLPAVIQTPYIDKREVRALLRSAGQPAAAPSLPEPRVDEKERQEADKDRLFKQRVEAGWSRNAASLEIYGRRYAGDLVARGKRILGEI